MKYQRPGYTETTLMFCEYLKVDKPRIEWINWLYTTSGFYDKQIKGSYFWEYETKKILESENYKNFIAQYTKSLKNSDKLCPLFHKTNFDHKRKEFIEYLQPTSLFDWCDYKNWYMVLKDKKVLLVNGFSPLMQHQYENGNLHKIDPNFPIVSDIKNVRTPYSFFNTGPDSNFFETLENIKQQIVVMDFDIAIISCGAYAALLCDYCNSIGRTGICIGSRMHSMFGIDPKNDNPLWINKIPQEYIPNIPEKYKQTEIMNYYK
jgi:hypothetical protein